MVATNVYTPHRGGTVRVCAPQGCDLRRIEHTDPSLDPVARAFVEALAEGLPHFPIPTAHRLASIRPVQDSDGLWYIQRSTLKANGTIEQDWVSEFGWFCLEGALDVTLAVINAIAPVETILNRRRAFFSLGGGLSVTQLLPPSKCPENSPPPPIDPDTWWEENESAIRGLAPAGVGMTAVVFLPSGGAIDA